MAVHKRVTFSLSTDVIKLLDNIAPRNKKSSIVEKAVIEYARKLRKEALEMRLKDGYMANAEQDLEIAREFYPLEAENLPR